MNTCKAMDYLIDANCFIESKNVTNPLDVAISFWAKIKDLALAGTGSKHSVKLPDACAQKGVSCLRIMEMLREMGETF